MTVVKSSCWSSRRRRQSRRVETVRFEEDEERKSTSITTGEGRDERKAMTGRRGGGWKQSDMEKAAYPYLQST